MSRAAREAVRAAARAVVRRRYPGARAVFLAGSAAGDEIGAGADLDLVVLLPEPGPVLRETIASPGPLFAHTELFVHTEASWLTFVERETAQRRSPLLHMSAHGVLVLDVDGAGARVQAQARVRWANGPAPLAAPECEELRHRLTDLLDDLRSVADPAERLAVGARVLTAAGELALLHRRRWTGTGKWLVRRWAEACPRECAAVVEAVRVLAAEGDPAPLAAAAGAVLDAAGGPCTVGFRRVAPNAASHVSAGATIP